MSILHGKQIADAGHPAIASATASINRAARFVLADAPITFLKNLRALFFDDNHPDHTRLLIRKAKVAIGTRHREFVAVVAARRDEAGVERHRALRHRSVLAVLSICGAGTDRM